MENLIVIGVDVGQQRNPSAICVVEIEERPAAHQPIRHFLVRHLEKLPLGTPFPEVAQRLNEVCGKIRQRTGGSLYLYVDATGIGQPIIDLFYEEVIHLGLIMAVYFNHGDQCHREGREIRLGKEYLVSRLKILLQSGRLHLPQTQEAKELADDLLNFEKEIDENANERYGAFPVGRHDALVTALGLALHSEPPRPGIY